MGLHDRPSTWPPVSPRPAKPMSVNSYGSGADPFFWRPLETRNQSMQAPS